MGSKQALSNGKEPEELTDLLAAFEMHNSCKLRLNASIELCNGYLDTKWVCTATNTTKQGLEVDNSALVSVEEWGGRYKTLMGLLTRLLYSMDFALAEAEFAKATIK